jgi:hypothetical protein
MWQARKRKITCQSPPGFALKPKALKIIERTLSIEKNVCRTIMKQRKSAPSSSPLF